MFTGLFKNCRRTYHQKKQEHGKIITNDSCLYDSTFVLGNPVRNQNVIFVMQRFKRSGTSLKPFCCFMTSCPDGTARFIKSPANNLPPRHGKKTHQNASVVDKMSLPNSQGSNDSKPLHLMSKKSHY
jgi:hypothetical protein